MLVSRDEAYLVRQKVTVAEVSTKLRAIRSEVALGHRDGMPKACAINADNLVTIPKVQLESKIVSLSAAKLRELDAALRFSFGLADLDAPG
ncbi:MAG: type II toxin-antitoxin system PemK/MazF family toxin [Myxococcota bacterium]|nr:type II toxin-antitoxin system PemK/MazF family toxin [Myxococcota bacterium]